MVILVIIAVVFLIWVANKFGEPNTPNYSNYNFSPGSKVYSIEQAREIERRDKFRAQKEQLRSCIQNAIDLLDDSDDSLDQFYVSEYKRLLTTPINTDEDYDDVVWEFNNGNLRSRNEKYVHSGQYKNDCSMTTIIFSIVGFLIGFIPPMCFFAGEGGGIECAIPSAIPGFFCMLIAQIIAHSLNISRGKRLDTPEADPIIREQKIKRGVAITATAISTASTVHHAKKSVKEFSNVDSWKEFK